MSLYKRKDSPYYWVKLEVDGRRIQQSTGTSDKRAAREAHDRLAAEAWRLTQFGEQPERSWEEATVKYIEETKSKRSHETDLCRLRVIAPFMSGLSLSEINREVVVDVLDRAASASKKKEWTPGTRNRVSSIVHNVLARACHDWRWIDNVPTFRRYKEPDGRNNFLDEMDFLALVKALPPHLRPPCFFALATGLRRSNAIQIRWDHINMDRRVAWVDPQDAKGKKRIQVALNEVALDVLEECKGDHPDRVFIYEGQPFNQFNHKTWTRALEKAGLEKGMVTFHTLRHTWASWHAMAGTHPTVLKELGGWSSLTMVDRYTHLSQSHLQAAAENVSLKSGYDLATLINSSN